MPQLSPMMWSVSVFLVLLFYVCMLIMNYDSYEFKYPDSGYFKKVDVFLKW